MKFIEQDHIYVNDEGEVYSSATSFIKTFCHPFEKQKIATKFAKKHKRTVEDVIAEWEKAGADAIKKGTAFHKIKEDELLALNNVVIEGEDHEVFASQWDNGVKTVDKLSLEPGIYPELIVWSDKYQIAGQADYIEITKGGKINILDYKTSKEIKMKGFEKWDGTVQKMLFPLQNLDDCNFNHYSLQINLYAFLVKNHNRNLEIGKLTIQHIAGEYDESEDKFTITNIVDYPVPNMQKEIKIVLDYWNHKKN